MLGAALVILTLVPFNMGGCSSDPIASIGSLASGANSSGDKTADYIGAGLKFTQAATMSDKDEHDLGQAVAIAVTNQYPLYSNASVTDYVTKVGLTVAAFSGRTEINYVFGVLDTDEIGAFSGPGGYIMITRGALANMQDESELAGVLAHEVGHVAKKHGFEAAQKAKMAQAGIQAGAAGTQFASADFADAVVDVVMRLGYTKAQETDADAAAVKYLIAAGYDPHGYLNFLQRLEKLRGSGGGMKNVMSTHPGLGERVKHVQEKIQKAGNPHGTTLKDRFATNVVLTKTS